MQTSPRAERIPPAADLKRALEEAESIATGVGQRVSTTHVLLALFTVPNPAQVLLREKGIDENVLLEQLPKGAKERQGAVRGVLRYAEETAVACDALQINTLHLLIGFLKSRDTVAYDLLEKTLEKTSPFRNMVMSYVTGVLPRRLMQPILDAKHDDMPIRPRRPLPRPVQHKPSDDWVVPKHTMLDMGGPAALVDSTPPEEVAPVDVRAEAPPAAVAPEASSGSSFVDSALAYDDDDDASFIDEEDEALIDEDDEDAGYQPRPITRAPTLLPTAFDLDPDKFPWLVALGRNLSSLAQHGLIDPAVGRSGEVEQIVDVLGKRRANNPCLVGEPGVGKTAIVEGLAVKLMRGDPDVAPLLGKVIIELDMGRITAGTALRGSFSERMQGLKKDVERAKGRVIVFIDEIHTLMGAGTSGDGPQDAANELKAALARGAFPCIGSTTLDEYRKYIEADPALERRFVRVQVDEPDEAATIEILKGAAPLYEEHHQVSLKGDALSAAVQLSSRFVHDRKLPGKALDLLDLSMSRARRSGLKFVDRKKVAEVCADVAKVPLERVLLEDAKRFLDMEKFLSKHVVGHEEIINNVAETIRRNYAGFASHRPMGSFLFLGPSGVGKTELAKVLADFLYGSADALIRLDMSEFSERHTVSRLVGAPPGYIGHDEGGQLTEAIRRRPHAVVLLDEIEKAHRDIFPLLLQILDEGRLTDSKGRTVTFRHSVVIMTSNLGADAMKKQPKVGFRASNPSLIHDQAVVDKARRHFAPELWGRIEEKLVFSHLSKRQLIAIAGLLMNQSAKALATTRSIELVFDDELLNYVVDTGAADDDTGARPLRGSIQRLVENPLSAAILKGDIREGSRVRLDIGAQGVTPVAVRRA